MRQSIFLVCFLVLLASFETVSVPVCLAGDWLSDFRLTYSDVDGDDPSGRGNLITDLDGNIYAAWQIVRGDRKLDDIALMIFKRRTGMWEPAPGSLPYIATFCYGSITNHFSVDPSIAITSDGIIHAVGLDLRDTTPTDPTDTARVVNTPSYRYFNPKDKTWSTCNFITFVDGEGNLPHVVNDHFDNLYVTWFDNRTGYWEIYFQRKDAGTGTWEPSETIVSTLDYYESRDPFATVDHEGNLYVVWEDNLAFESTINFRRRDFITGLWDPIEEVTDAPVNLAEKAVACVDSDSRIHFVWLDLKDGNSELYHRMKDGTTWGASFRLTNNVYKNQAPYITCDKDGNVHLIYLEGETIDQYELLYRKWSAATETWSDPQVIVTQTVGRTIFGPKITSDQYRNIHVIWPDTRNDGNWELYYKKYSPLAPDPMISFDKPVYMGTSDLASITVVDASQNKDFFTRDEIQVLVFSDTYPDGVPVSLRETGIDTSIFSSAGKGNYLKFSTISSVPDPDNPVIQVWDGDELTVLYQDDSPIEVRTATAYWYESSIPTPTPGPIVPVNRPGGIILAFLLPLFYIFRFRYLD